MFHVKRWFVATRYASARDRRQRDRTQLGGPLCRLSLLLWCRRELAYVCVYRCIDGGELLKERQQR